MESRRGARRRAEGFEDVEIISTLDQARPQNAKRQPFGRKSPTKYDNLREFCTRNYDNPAKRVNSKGDWQQLGGVEG